MRRRSKKWFKKNVRCTPEAFDSIVNRIKPIFAQKYPLYRNVQFSIDHRVAVTLNYLNVGDFGLSAAMFGMSQSTCYRCVNQVYCTPVTCQIGAHYECFTGAKLPACFDA